MAQISIINYSDVLEAHRFDAEYFKPEYLRELSILNNFKTKNIGDFAFITDGQQGYHEVDINSNIFHLTAKHMKNWFAANDGADKLAKLVDEKNKRSSLQEEDIILSTRGSLGYSALVTKEILPANIDQDVARIKINTGSDIIPTFLLTYLNSYFGQNWIIKNCTGMVQQGLSLEKVRQIKIPILSQSFQLQIEKIVKEAYQKQTQSKQLYREAEELLLAELGLLNYHVKHSLTFQTTKKEVDEAKRFDSEYFQPKYKEIIEKIEKYEGGFDVVGEMIKWKKGVEVGSEAYQETGKDFVRVSDFSIYGVEKTNQKISDELFEELKKNFQPKKDEILFTEDGTIGVNYVLKEDIQGVLSGAFLRLSLKEEYQDFEKECLALIFNSIFCKMQVEKLSGRALIAHLKLSEFEKFKIPLIKPQIQKQIAEKIQESHKLRKESKDLLEEAKRKVEEEIEKEAKNNLLPY